MKKMIENKMDTRQELSRFSGVPAAEKRLYWSGSPWNAFRLLGKKRG